MAASRLFESPYTDMAAQGPMGVFPPAKFTQLLEVLTEIRARAAA